MATTTQTDELLVLAEAVADIKERFERVETELSTQAKPLEGAANALAAALAGIKSLQFHVLDNNLGALSVRVEEQRKAIDEQLGVIVADLKNADAKTAEDASKSGAAIRAELESVREQIGRIVTQFSQEVLRVELAAKDEAKKFAALPGASGKDGQSFNPRGKWDPAQKYNRLDVVSLVGSSYVSNEDGNTEKPSADSPKWTLLASRAIGVGGAASQFAEATTQITLTDAATTTWDLSSPVAQWTLGGNRTLAVTNMRAGGTYILHVKQDATGSRTVTWPSSVKWGSGITPTLTTTASYRDVVSFTSDGTYLFANIAQNFAV